jgi:type II secretory ATPase GspE/PulE/Tfp pilus assembly ATPase PilB-like protein
MPRISIAFAATLSGVLFHAELAFGQQPGFTRGSGMYFSIVKLVLILIVFWFWVRTSDWVSFDCQTLSLDHSKWSPTVFFPFLIGFLISIFIPGPGIVFYFVNFPLLILCLAVPLSMYIRHRNHFVTVDERVMTKAHIRHVLATRTKLGVKAEKEKPYEKGAKVELRAMGADDEQKNQANILAARQQAEAYVAAKDLIAETSDRRAEKAMLDYTPQDVKLRLLIDGVWHDAGARERASGDLMLEVMKKIANLNEKDRRNKQDGKFGANYKDFKYLCLLSTQGVQTGERVLLTLTIPKEKKFKTLEDLGMREKQREKLLKLMMTDKGLFLFSSLPGGGLTTTGTIALGSTDRLLRDFLAVENARQRNPDVENIDPTTYDPGQGEKPMTKLPSLIRRHPDAIVVMDLVEKETLEYLIAQVNERPLLFFTGINAKDASEALLRLLATYKVPPQDVAPILVGVLYTRLIRKLCTKCKEAYQPAPQLLQKLGIPPDRVTEWHRERQPPGPDATEKEKKEKSEPCKKCGGIGYFGRTAFFELLEVNDQVREALIKQPKLEVIKKIARATGSPNLQDEGLLLVAQGVTSLEELQRVLKQ